MLSVLSRRGLARLAIVCLTAAASLFASSAALASGAGPNGINIGFDFNWSSGGPQGYSAAFIENVSGSGASAITCTTGTTTATSTACDFPFAYSIGGTPQTPVVSGGAYNTWPSNPTNGRYCDVNGAVSNNTAPLTLWNCFNQDSFGQVFMASATGTLSNVTMPMTCLNPAGGPLTGFFAVLYQLNTVSGGIPQGSMSVPATPLAVTAVDLSTCPTLTSWDNLTFSAANFAQIPIPFSGVTLTAGNFYGVFFAGNLVPGSPVPGFSALSVALAGTGSGTVTSSDNAINCGATCSSLYQDGSQVTLIATAAAGSVFAGWSGGSCNGTVDPCQITVGAADTEKATFNQIPSFMLSVTSGGPGAGAVTSSPSGINCGATCSASFQQGTQVVLSAAPAAGSIFSGWNGAGCSGVGTCTVTMIAAENVSATFSTLTESLTVAEAGSGAGQVTSSPAGINCSVTSNQCAAPFAFGTQVTLTASASAGSSFAGWSGGGCSGTSTCQVTMSAAQSVTATFNVIPSFMLSVVSSGTGSGTVTSSPSGINCGATCNASFQTGTQVTLSATPASGSTFAGWSGGGCGGDQSCGVTLTAATTVTASFVANTPGNLTLEAAVLPLSRSVQVGNTAAAFATMINAGQDNASTCTITPATSIPASFMFQTTNPSTNALTGTANTPVNITAGQAQSFVIAFTPTAAFAPTNVAFTFVCANAPSPATTTIGVDTLNLSASATPVPDIVAANTTSDPGYVDVSPTTRTGAFAVATFDMGAAATITASANTGAANLPVTLTICQTNPATGACLATPAASVAPAINSGDADTFAVFVLGSSAIPDMPAVNRVFVTFTDSNGVLRGETSVAVRTQ